MRVRPGEADALQGLDSTLAVIDEMHTATDSDAYVAMVGSLKATGAKLRIISTAAPSADSPLGRLRARALALPDAKRRGAVVEAKGPDLHLLEWSCPEGTKLTDRRRILAANPASWRTWEVLRKRRDAVPESSFRRYFMNQHAAIGESAWLPGRRLGECRADYAIEDGERVFVGIDVGGVEGRHRARLRHRGPAGRRPDVGGRGGRDLRRGGAARAGRAVHDRGGRVRPVAVRRPGARPLEGRPADGPVSRSTTPGSSRPRERLSAAILERRLRHPGDPVLDAHVAAAVAKQTQRGARIAHAGGRHSSNRIDAVIALAMAVDRAENQPEPVRMLGWL